MHTPEELCKLFPFISIVLYGDDEYIGIIVNQDASVTTMYDLSALRTEAERKSLLELGEEWWWESNRSIPITIYLKKEIGPYKYCSKSFSTKDVQVLAGPITKLSDLQGKKTKRKVVQLVRPTPYQ